MPTVDIIVPAYNAAKYLAEALESVAQQTFSDWRIVLVNDGSTDETEQIALSFAARFGSKMLVVTQPNRGLPAARNAAMRQGDSPFLALLDADDVWLPHRLAASLTVFEGAPEVGLAYGGVTLIDSGSNTITTPTLVDDGDEGWIASGIYTRKLDLPCPTITFRRSCIDAVGDFDETLRASEDRDLWLRIAQKFQVARVPEVIALYRMAAGSMSSDPDRMRLAQIAFIDKHFGTPGCDARSRRLARSSVYRQTAETLSARGAHIAAVSYIARSLALRPLLGRNWRTLISIVSNIIR